MRKMLEELNNPSEHIKKLLDFAIEEVISAGGDGDCLIMCKKYDAGNLANICNNMIYQKYNFYWLIQQDDDGITLYDNQESIRFTNNLQEEYPDWQQCVIII